MKPAVLIVFCVLVFQSLYGQDFIQAVSGRNLHCTIVKWGQSFLEVKLPNVKETVRVEHTQIQNWYTPDVLKKETICASDSSLATLYLELPKIRENAMLKQSEIKYKEVVFNPIYVYEAGALLQKSLDKHFVALGLGVVSVALAGLAAASIQVKADGTIDRTYFTPLMGAAAAINICALGFEIRGWQLKYAGFKKLQMVN